MEIKGEKKAHVFKKYYDELGLFRKHGGTFFGGERISFGDTRMKYAFQSTGFIEL